MYVQLGSHGGAYYVPVEIQSALFTLQTSYNYNKIEIEVSAAR